MATPIDLDAVRARSFEQAIRTAAGIGDGKLDASRLADLDRSFVFVVEAARQTYWLTARDDDHKHLKKIANRIGVRAQAARLALGLTQAELGEAVGITTQSVSRLEPGGAAPSYPTLLRLCAVLKVSPNDLLLERAPAKRDTPNKLSQP